MIQFPLSNFTEDEDFPFVIQYGAHEKNMYLHSHKDFSELVIVLSGTAEHLVDAEHYRIRKGDVFVINQDTAHGYEDAEDFRMCNIMFRPSFFMTPEVDITQSPGFQALFVLEPHDARTSRFCSRLKLDMIEFSQLQRIIETLYQEYTLRQTGWKTMVKSDFLRLIIMLSRWYRYEAIQNSPGSVKLAGALAFMEKHYAETILVSQLASLSHYSQRQFIRLFKDAFSCIPMAYLTNLRMQKAQELLKTTQLSMTEISERCGYSDSNYFSRIFKKYHCMTPSDYRSTF